MDFFFFLNIRILYVAMINMSFQFKKQHLVNVAQFPCLLPFSKAQDLVVLHHLLARGNKLFSMYKLSGGGVNQVQYVTGINH